MFRTVWRLSPQWVSRIHSWSAHGSFSSWTVHRRSRVLAVAFTGATAGCLGYSGVTADSNSLESDHLSSPTRSKYKYLICGGGIAAQEALKVCVEEGMDSDLLLVSPEWGSRWHPPKECDPENQTEDNAGLFSSIASGLGAAFPAGLTSKFRKQAADVVIGPRVSALDTARRIATLDNGTEIAFERCLIAVGNTMPNIPVGKVVSRSAGGLVSGAQSTTDWKQINAVIRDGFDSPNVTDDNRAHLTVVGGGWMSTSVGATLIDRGANVTFSHAEPAFLARYFPKYLSQELYSRLVWLSGGGIDSLSYSALRYVIARTPLSPSFRPVEAEVHVGTVFDAFSIVDFRTDHVVFAPTLSPHIPLTLPAALAEDGGLVVNPELAAASDIYVAGAAISARAGALQGAEVMRWSADHARATGRHAAQNMLGGRAPYTYRPHLVVDLAPVALRVHVVGDVDGSAESFGYFRKSRKRDEETGGGGLEIGVLFCVTPAPLSHRGAAQKLVISGVALWEGRGGRGIQNVAKVREVASGLLGRGGVGRPELERIMDAFAMEQLGITLYADMETEAEGREGSTKKTTEEREGLRETIGEGTGRGDVNGAGMDGKGEVGQGGEMHATGQVLEPLGDLRRPSPRVIWRRHRAARGVRVRADELMWVESEWGVGGDLGGAGGGGGGKHEALAALLRKGGG